MNGQDVVVSICSTCDIPELSLHITNDYYYLALFRSTKMK